MKTTAINTLIALLACSSTAFAASASSTGSTLLLTLFIGFFALIVVCQLVPAALLLFGMLKGLVGRESRSHS